MSHAQTERALTCDALAAVDPSAPTLCRGWDAHDLAAHLWVRENELLAAAGIMVPALKGRTEQRMAEIRAWLTYVELIAALRAGPPRLSPFGLPGADEAANSLEYFIHGEDVRRANPGIAQHPQDPSLEELCWKRLPFVARMGYGKVTSGLLLDRTDLPAEPIRVHPGAEIVTVTGRPTELILHAYGRASVADVEVFAPAEAATAFVEATS